MRQSHLAVAVVLSFCLSSAALAQFEEAAGSVNGPQLDKTLTQHIKIGMTIRAVGGPCQGIVGTAPIPTEWREQQVKIVDEETTPNVRKIQFRTLPSGVQQMIVSAPRIASGEEAKAIVTFEVTRSSLLPPTDTSIYSIPKKVDRQMAIYIGTSPYIEPRHPKIRTLARELGEGLEGWAKVEAIYDGVREKVQLKEEPTKSAVAALGDGYGDKEALTSLFIAVCRAADIPARTVWIEQHCYAEFYLEDPEGVGHWFPAQVAGTKEFGGIAEHRPILQKGDNVRDPDRPREQLRFVNEFMKGAAVRGGGQPKVKFIREMVAQ